MAEPEDVLSEDAEDCSEGPGVLLEGTPMAERHNCWIYFCPPDPFHPCVCVR